LKSGSLPAKADPEAQRAFYDNTLHPLMQMAYMGTRTVLFVDASHFVLGSNYLGSIYGMTHRFVRTFSGRSRYNVLGALNLVTKNMTTITNKTYITATEVCELISKIVIEYHGQKISLILDNAKYQRCKIVQAVALEFGIELVFIPPYSPNLNLIERYWQFVKDKLRRKYFDKFSIFCETIDSIAACKDKKDKKEVERLISTKIQLFDDLEPVNGSKDTFQKGERKAQHFLLWKSQFFSVAAIFTCPP
jgi:transposase